MKGIGMNRKILAASALIVAVCLFLTACGSGNARVMGKAASAAPAAVYTESMAMAEDSMAYNGYAYASDEETGYAPEPSPARGSVMPAEEVPADAAVRKIIYNAGMTITADDPEKALSNLCDMAVSLCGYVASSYTTNDDFGANYANATLKVPAESLDTLVNAAGGQGRIDDYNLSSSDISQSYYDVKARLDSAKAEEKALLEILDDCKSVEDVLAVRESLLCVRSEIESYQGQINLWDNLVSYATLDVSIRRTPRTVVEEKNDLIELWKASDVWQNMKDGFVNSARFVVNAVGAIGIFIAIAIIPAGILFLAIGLPIILHKKKKKRLAEQAKANAEPVIDAQEQGETVQKNE